MSTKTLSEAAEENTLSKKYLMQTKDKNTNPEVFSPWSYDAGATYMAEIKDAEILELKKSLNFAVGGEYNLIPLLREEITWLRLALEKYSDKYIMKEVIDEWIIYWMNQTQNSEEDYKNYLRRAMGVDANMRHHLAKLISNIAREALTPTQKVEAE